MNEASNGFHGNGNGATRPAAERNETSLVPLLLTEKQVAELLNICTRTVQKLAACGKLQRVPIGEKMQPKHHRAGGRKPCVRYRRRQVLELAEKGWVWS